MLPCLSVLDREKLIAENVKKALFGKVSSLISALLLKIRKILHEIGISPRIFFRAQLHRLQ